MSLVVPDHPLASRLARYGMAVLVVGVAVALRVALASIVPPLRSPFLLLFAAIMASASYGGLGPGILAAILAALASDLFVTGFPVQFSDFHVPELAQLSLFFAEGLFLSLLGAMLHRTRRRAMLADVAARRLEQKILETSEGERRRIGHDLHDGLGQHLTGIALLAKSLKQRLTGAKASEAEQAAKIAELVNESIGWTRDLARGLSPVTLDTEGLAPALEELAVNASNILGIKCTCDCDDDEFAMNHEHALHLYRIAQEAINNSVKHGKARNVRVGLLCEGPAIKMTIVDDGSGLSAKTMVNPGIGLQIMQYRARMIGATLSMARVAPAGGTLVTCSLPAPEPGATREGPPLASPAPSPTMTTATPTTPQTGVPHHA
jgi:signal transduction histidine kinase